MAQLLQPFSFGTSESIEDAFIAPPDNIQESRDAMEEVERRLLYDDFQRCGILPESLLNLSELLMRLRSSSRQYDEEMVQRIYAALSSYKGSRDAYTTGRVFIEAYMKRRRELVAVLESARGELDSAEMMLQQAETHLANLAVDPNAALAEDSKLTAQIASLHNLNQGSPSASDGDVFKVHLECQQQVIETAPARVEGGSCYFNEVFSFEIAVREGDLRICLVKVDPASGAEELVGDCSVLLEDLADQKKREIVKDIWGHAGEIILSCQWIFSKRTLYEQYLQEFTLRREAKIRELSDYQEELDKLNRPFCTVEAGRGGICGWIFLLPEILSRQLDDLKTYLKLPGWLLTSQYAVALTFLLSSIAGFSRSVFLDQAIVAFLFWNNLDPQRWTLGRYSFLMLACIAGISFDLWWLRVYLNAWRLGSAEADMHDISKIFSIFLCVWKARFSALLSAHLPLLSFLSVCLLFVAFPESSASRATRIFSLAFSASPSRQRVNVLPSHPLLPSHLCTFMLPVAERCLARLQS
ncbi:uncharacterized protein LOC34622865 [Cyclospora cayetanensis]|uniref:Uncharacterized protein LOC34622865 n=1 Tax=Cyclospora cayetanensis TaxID=88456 RepID=A0A6P6RTL2_9EIME|nr:uncharacterized protein LOC34622865 [Cyclospora cayetanensis]